MIHGISKTFKLEKLQNWLGRFRCAAEYDLREAPVLSYEARHYLYRAWDAP